MRYAIISDIHSNAAALRAVLTDAQDCGAERVICLGDVLGYGPEPVETLEIVYKRVHICLAGNHDDAICGRGDASDFSAFAASAAARQSLMLTAQAKNWLRSLPYVWSKGEFACAHGDFSDPKSFFYITSPEEAMPSWSARKEKLLFVGHTHEPCIFVIGPSGVPRQHSPVDFQIEAGKRYVVNVGSVGYPRSGSCRSCYVIWDDRTKVVTFRTLPFDLDGYREKMNGRGLEEAPWIGRRQKERARPDVRTEVKFGASGQAKPVVKRPHARTAVVAVAAAAALALALAAAYVCVRSFGGGAAQEAGAEPRAPAAAEAVRPSPEKDSPPSLGAFKRHVDGWSYAIESDADQEVSSDGEPGFLKVSNNGNRRMVFRKEIAVKDGDVKVHLKVRILPKGVGRTRYELKYFNAAGETLRGANEFLDARSKNVRLALPKGAVRAQLTVEYSFSGVTTLELPYFTAVSRADDADSPARDGNAEQ